MTSVLKDFVYLQEVPFWIRDRAAEGYTEFRVSLKDARKPTRERSVVRAWKPTKQPGTFACECGVMCRNALTLDMHQKAKRHGPYQAAPDKIILATQDGRR